MLVSEKGMAPFSQLVSQACSSSAAIVLGTSSPPAVENNVAFVRALARYGDQISSSKKGVLAHLPENPHKPSPPPTIHKNPIAISTDSPQPTDSIPI